jgi:arylsulfatase A-like enzyme
MRTALCLSAVLACWAAPALCHAQNPRPNIVVIVADDMGYGDIGVHGCKDIPTPHIDSLAKNGVRCTSGYVSGPYCSPTRAGLMTGRYQQRFGHEFNPGPPGTATQDIGLSLKETTVADRFKAAGYRTGMVGKWHLGYDEKFNPVKRGFEEYFGFLGGAHSYLKDQANHPIVRGTKPVEEKDYLTDAFAREAVAYIDRHAKEPFFLYLSFNAVHTPMEATDKYLKRFESIADQGRRSYAAMLSAMDDAIGRVLAKLRAAGLEENTLIFFFSDNGGPQPVNSSKNTPLHGNKASTWEGGIRVPYLVQWKAKLPGGKTYDHPVIQLDIVPTALAAAGVEIKPEWKLDGVNLLPHLTGTRTAPPHDALYWRFGGQLAIRMGDWKLVKAREDKAPLAGKATLDGAKLFNLASDIGEQTDLAAKNAEKLKEMSALWQKWNAELAEPTFGPPRLKPAPSAQ